MKLKELLDYTGQLLQVERYRDYCPNGLQVQGRDQVLTIVSGVTASMALLEAAQAAQADMILVHHGYFWRNEDPRVIGLKQVRLKFLFAHEINLVAYHLPLDGHRVLGNNAQLAQVMGMAIDGWAGEQELIAHGHLPQPMRLRDFELQLGRQLQRPPLVIGKPDKLIHRIAWCTGAAQGYIEAAVELGVDAFISGEVSEQTVHIARESDIAYLSAGHHATERYGIKALGEHLAQQFGLEHRFIDVENPV